MLFDYIQYLPYEIISIIWNKLSKFQKVFVNKENYLKFNNLIDKMIIRGRYESYIRDIIRNDYKFIFENIFHRRYNDWLYRRYDYKYDNKIYSNYIDFLLFYTNKNNSRKCYNFINLQLQLSELKKKGRKNNRLIYNKWSN
uniref:Uncharacterized protein n=1 Tax=viral metagenome TaxID=1070528 RepID=A0A6C0AWX7_9ZZZZ|tara:strand:+ start:62427 stop:62849 length:423 start_codon:yes stop_codon:yes gene_type:complete